MPFKNSISECHNFSFFKCLLFFGVSSSFLGRNRRRLILFCPDKMGGRRYTLQDLVGWKRVHGEFPSEINSPILAGVGGLKEGLKGNFLLGFTYLGTSLQELVGWRKGSRGTSFWDSLTWEHPCRSWQAVGKAQRDLPAGIHLPGNILAAVGRLKERLKGIFLLEFTHLGTSLQE